jgi:hypothetical protein
MKALLLLLVVLASANNFQKFNDFVVKYEKKYDSLEELEFRFKVFEQNLERIAKLNAENVAAGGDECHGVNAFTDMTKEEFGVRLMKDLPPYNAKAPEMPAVPFVMPAPETDVDWRQSGAITAVKDQGNCGSCWAHSADEATESFSFLAKKTPLDVLSVQQCTACTYNYNGCNGGWPYDAYTAAIEKRNGIDLDSDYPYNIAAAGTCKFGPTGNADKPVVNDNGYKSVAKGQMANYLLSTGPLSVCVAAESWQTYTGGVMMQCVGSVDHCVQAVGYNTTAMPNTPYWIVRNSWGTGWGVSGYIWLSMTADQGDICHIQEYMTYPTF